MLDKMAKGIVYLYPACIWTIGLAGVILASWWNGNSRMVQSGSCLLLCFGVFVLGAAWVGGWSTKW